MSWSEFAFPKVTTVVDNVQLPDLANNRLSLWKINLVAFSQATNQMFVAVSRPTRIIAYNVPEFHSFLDREHQVFAKSHPDLKHTVNYFLMIILFAIFVLDL